MREIIFRGKRQDNGEWMYGDLRHWRSGDVGIHCEVTKNTVPVDTDTVGQYVGMKDDKGNRIFEGDVLHFDYVGTNLGVNGVEAVVFENGKFGVKWGTSRQFVCLNGFANTTMDVVGNVHDNAELLEDDKP